MSLIKDLFDKVIQIQIKTLQKLQNKVQIDSSGNLPFQAATSYCKQKVQQVSGTSIGFKNDISIYTIDITENTELSFNYSSLDRENNSFTFQLWINMDSIYSITFPSSVSWLNDEAPDMSQPGLYCIAFRILPITFTDTRTISSPVIIGNLNYYHAITLD